MADIDEKTEKNVPGKFYVDSNCIDCDLCRDSAPDFFARCWICVTVWTFL